MEHRLVSHTIRDQSHADIWAIHGIGVTFHVNCWVNITISMDENDRKRVGQTGEDIACEFLERKGFKVLERNYRKPWGEIDIIAEKGGVVRFVEVKAVSRESLPDISREMDYRPEEMVTENKLKKVARTAALYMENKKDKREYQIDVVGVIMDVATKKARCRLIEQALEDNL